MIETRAQELEDLQSAVDEALWEYDPVRGALWGLQAEAMPDGVVEVRGHVRSRVIRDGVLAALQAVPSVQRIVDRIVSDPELEAKVARVLAQIDELPVGAVAVHSHLGKLTLVGKLPAEPLRDPVLQAARAVPGVRGVDDRLRVAN